MYYECLLSLWAIFPFYGGETEAQRGKYIVQCKVVRPQSNLEKPCPSLEMWPLQASSYSLFSLSCTFFPALSLSPWPSPNSSDIYCHDSHLKTPDVHLLSSPNPLPTVLILRPLSSRAHHRAICTCPLLLPHFSFLPQPIP